MEPEPAWVTLLMFKKRMEVLTCNTRESFKVAKVLIVAKKIAINKFPCPLPLPSPSQPLFHFVSMM
jgi:hypothetical protein